MVTTSTVPADSVLLPLRAQADYCDAFTVAVAIADAGRPALAWYLDFAARTPAWIDVLMDVRNAAVRLFALKDVGRLHAVPPAAAAGQLGRGDRVGIFTIRSVSDGELVLEIIDSHLDVVLSVFKRAGAAPSVTVTTMVFYHNVLGRLYMLPVAPMHRIVVRAILARGAAAPMAGGPA